MMRFSSLAYLARQGWKNMINNRLMTLGSIGILTACLFITGAAVLLGLNVNNFASFLAGQNEVILFLKDGIEVPAPQTPAEGEQPAEDTQTPAVVLQPVNIEAAVAVLESIDNIESYTYVTKDEALDEAIGWMRQYGDLLEAYREDNPLPASFRVTVRDLEQLDATVAQLSTIEGVEYINSPSSMAQILVSIKTAVNWVALGLVSVLGVVCIVVIGNTIRLTVFARRREINIMKYVGATNSFIRFPFFVEGMTSGLVSGLLAFGLLSLGYTQLVRHLTTDGLGNFTWINNLFFTILPYESLQLQLLGGFLAVGLVLGGLGTADSVRKYLRV